MIDIWTSIKEKADEFRGSEIQKKVRTLLSSSSHGITTGEKNSIANATRDYRKCREVMDIIWEKITPSENNWRIITYGLTLLDSLIRLGSESVVNEVFDRDYILKDLTNYNPLMYSSHNSDLSNSSGSKGGGVRDFSKKILDLLGDKDALKSVRAEAKKNQFKYTQSISSENSYSYSNNNSYYSGDSYDNHSYDSHNSNSRRYTDEPNDEVTSKKKNNTNEKNLYDDYDVEQEKNVKPKKTGKKIKKKKKQVAVEDEISKGAVPDEESYQAPKYSIVIKEKESNAEKSQPSSTNDDDFVFENDDFNPRSRSQPPISKPSNNNNQVDSFFDDWTSTPTKVDNNNNFDVFASAVPTNPNPVVYNNPVVNTNIATSKIQPKNSNDLDDLLSFDSQPSKPIQHNITPLEAKNDPVSEFDILGDLSSNQSKPQVDNNSNNNEKDKDICWDSSLVDFNNLSVTTPPKSKDDIKKKEQSERDMLFMQRPHATPSYLPPQMPYAVPGYGYPYMNSPPQQPYLSRQPVNNVPPYNVPPYNVPPNSFPF